MKREQHEREGTAVPSFRAELGTRLRELEKKFKNRAAAAMAAGVAKSTLQSWIEGRADPSFEGLFRLAQETGVSLDWIATGRGPASGTESPPPAAPETVSPFDEALLTDAATVIEEFLAERRATLPPAKKAQAISALYMIGLQQRQDGRSLDENVARTVLRLIA